MDGTSSAEPSVKDSQTLTPEEGACPTALPQSSNQEAPLWHFVGASLLGVIYPLGTWAVARRYPQTDRFAWGLLFIMMVWLIVLAGLCQLLIPPMPRLELEDLTPPP
jgi:hypothetical protein